MKIPSPVEGPRWAKIAFWPIFGSIIALICLAQHYHF